jgi:hypothetical protein
VSWFSAPHAPDTRLAGQGLAEKRQRFADDALLNLHAIKPILVDAGLRRHRLAARGARIQKDVVIRTGQQNQAGGSHVGHEVLRVRLWRSDVIGLAAITSIGILISERDAGVKARTTAGDSVTTAFTRRSIREAPARARAA